jgi:deazaflavin-dependent oxidoreductase (nitroreductase family)
MSAVSRNKTLRFFLRAPIYLYRWHLGRLLGNRFLLIKHAGRRTGMTHETVLEVMQYRKEISEATVMSGFGRDSDWLRNIEARSGEEVQIGSKRFVACHRFLDEGEAMKVVETYERKNRLITPIVRRVLSRLLGWQYHGSEVDRQKLVRQLPLVAFRPF